MAERLCSTNSRGVTVRYLILLIVMYMPLSFANALYPLDNPRQRVQFEHLLTELRCLVCQNQDLANSNAGLADDLRLEVYRLVKEGRSDQEIIAYLTARYGDFILFNPPVKAITWLLWFGPFILLGIGCVLFWRQARAQSHDE